MTGSTLRLRSFILLPVLLLVTLGMTVPLDQPSSSQPGFYPMQQMYYLKKMKPDLKRVGIIWKKGVANQKEKLSSIKRAVASIQGKLFVGYVESKGDVGKKFRLMVREHNVQALWIVENDGVVDASAPRKYLIKNSVKKGVPLVAPSKEWVSAGAPLAIVKKGGSFRILLNEPAAKATALTVPSEYEGKTKLVAAAN